ncbi:MAG: ATP synthase F1 subunit gamma [Puniceicoccales bacterium]|jgi:F-type H+-transporting ATPase subunit gamma|nr:ATP synthase F1 subunit gamma [Puniceicoccales bacterium]
MEGMRDIGRRLRAVRGTAKITRAMQLVAGSKMRRAQQAATAGRRHSLRLEELTDRLIRLGAGADCGAPLLERRELRCRGIVFVATDRGLCGSLNQNTLRLIRESAIGESKYVAVGKKGAQLLRAFRLPLLGEFPSNDGTPYHRARALANFLRDAYLSRSIDSVEFAHPVFVNTLRQEPVLVRLLPLEGLAENLRRRRELLPGAGKPMPEDGRELCVEPSLGRILEALLESFFQREVYHILLEAKAAEQSSRTVAMKVATDNADALAKELTLAYNKARQAAITEEILEITAAKSAE